MEIKISLERQLKKLEKERLNLLFQFDDELLDKLIETMVSKENKPGWEEAHNKVSERENELRKKRRKEITKNIEQIKELKEKLKKT